MLPEYGGNASADKGLNYDAPRDFHCLKMSVKLSYMNVLYVAIQASAFTEWVEILQLNSCSLFYHCLTLYLTLMFCFFRENFNFAGNCHS